MSDQLREAAREFDVEREMAAILLTYKAEVVKKACAAVCPWCGGRSTPREATKASNGLWYHSTLPCPASAIRCAFPEVFEKGAGK
jgi:hypothetical protein